MNSALHASSIRKLLVGILCLTQVVSIYAAPGAVFVTGGPIKGLLLDGAIEEPAEVGGDRGGVSSSRSEEGLQATTLDGEVSGLS